MNAVVGLRYRVRKGFLKGFVGKCVQVVHLQENRTLLNLGQLAVGQQRWFNLTSCEAA